MIHWFIHSSFIHSYSGSVSSLRGWPRSSPGTVDAHMHNLKIQNQIYITWLIPLLLCLFGLSLSVLPHPIVRSLGRFRTFCKQNPRQNPSGWILKGAKKSIEKLLGLQLWKWWCNEAESLSLSVVIIMWCRENASCLWANASGLDWVKFILNIQWDFHLFFSNRPCTAGWASSMDSQTTNIRAIKAKEAGAEAATWLIDYWCK